MPTPDHARRPGITPPPYTKHVLIWSYTVVGSILNEDALPPPLFLCRYVIYLYLQANHTRPKVFVFLPILYKMFEKPLVMVLVPF